MTEMRYFTESWPIEGAFTISRGSKRQADVVVVALQSGNVTGYGECVPYSRYGESLSSVMAQIASLHSDVRNGLDRETLQTILPAGAARNALDCAFWDLECKQHQQRIWQRLDLLRLRRWRRPIPYRWIRQTVCATPRYIMLIALFSN